MELDIQDVEFLRTLIHGAQKTAESAAECRRKGVGSLAVYRHQSISNTSRWLPMYCSLNGNGLDVCTNEVGNCGCTHAEQRLIVDILSTRINKTQKFWLVQNYSPCTNCANLIVYSGLFEAVIWIIDTKHDMRGIDILRQNGIFAKNIS